MQQIDRDTMHLNPEAVYQLMFDREPEPGDVFRVSVIAQALQNAFDEGATAVCDGLEFADKIDSGERKFWMEAVKASSARV